MSLIPYFLIIELVVRGKIKYHSFICYFLGICCALGYVLRAYNNIAKTKRHKNPCSYGTYILLGRDKQ